MDLGHRGGLLTLSPADVRAENERTTQYPEEEEEPPTPEKDGPL